MCWLAAVSAACSPGATALSLSLSLSPPPPSRSLSVWRAVGGVGGREAWAWWGGGDSRPQTHAGERMSTGRRWRRDSERAGALRRGSRWPGSGGASSLLCACAHPISHGGRQAERIGPSWCCCMLRGLARLARDAAGLRGVTRSSSWTPSDGRVRRIAGVCCCSELCAGSRLLAPAAAQSRVM